MKYQTTPSPKLKTQEEKDERKELLKELTNLDKALLVVCGNGRHLTSVIPAVRLYLRKHGGPAFVSSQNIALELSRLCKYGLMERI